MKPRTRHRVRLTLTVAAAVVLGAAAGSVFRGVWVFYDDGAYREVGVSLVRATVYANDSDRSASSSLVSRMPRSGWRGESKAAVGSPAVEFVPSFGSQGMPVPSWAIRVPLWIPFVVLGVPAGWLWWKHLRRPAHECEACGYDLRGARGTRCPECGHTGTGTPAVMASREKHSP
jgi:hypothetical protein